jgi:glycosyltransferase A (GT-A) superfamily protein (DUF2064 family)
MTASLPAIDHRRAAASCAARRAIVVFTQLPARDARRKRLAGAEPLFDLLLRRTLDAAAALEAVDLVVAGDPGAAPLPLGARVVAQRGDSFGERLANAFDDVRSLGYDVVVTVGADFPGLTPRHLAAAFEALERATTVLGPARDGGIYLIGTRHDPRPTLRGIDWLTGRVLEQLVARVSDAAVLPEWLADIDRRNDLRAVPSAAALDLEVARLIAALLERQRAPSPRFVPPLQPALLAPIDPRGPPPTLAR